MYDRLYDTHSLTHRSLARSLTHAHSLTCALVHIMPWLEEDTLRYNMTAKTTMQNMLKTLPSTSNVFTNFQFILLYINTVLT